MSIIALYVIFLFSAVTYMIYEYTADILWKIYKCEKKN